MKKILLLLIIITLTSCYKAGVIEPKGIKDVSINGKIYKFKLVRPCDDCGAIWIMYPKDSLDRMPTILDYQAGKVTETVIKVN